MFDSYADHLHRRADLELLAERSQATLGSATYARIVEQAAVYATRANEVLDDASRAQTLVAMEQAILWDDKASGTSASKGLMSMAAQVAFSVGVRNSVPIEESLRRNVVNAKLDVLRDFDWFVLTGKRRLPGEIDGLRMGYLDALWQLTENSLSRSSKGGESQQRLRLMGANARMIAMKLSDGVINVRLKISILKHRGIYKGGKRPHAWWDSLAAWANGRATAKEVTRQLVMRKQAPIMCDENEESIRKSHPIVMQQMRLYRERRDEPTDDLE